MVPRTSLSIVIALLAASAGIAPAVAQSRLDEAAAALQRGTVDTAIQLYGEALADRGISNERRAVIHVDRGVAYARRQNWRAAIYDFNRAAQLAPDYAPIYNNRGNVLIAVGAAREAVKDFDRALVLSPSYAAAYSNRASAHLKLGNTDAALADTTRAIELQPASAAAFNARGMVHLAAERVYAAIRDFTRAATLDTRFSTAYRNRAEALAVIGRRDDVVEDLSRAIAFEPRSAELHVLRANGHMALDNQPAAIKDFDRAIELGGATALALTGRGLAHARAQAFDNALADLGKAIETDPRLSRAYAVRAFVYKLMQQPELGQRDVERAMRLEPVSADALWAQGEIAEAQGRTDAALAAYKKAVTLAPRHLETTAALARAGLVAAREETELAEAGIERWRVVQSGDRYFATNPAFEGLKVPLEMAGSGMPKLIEWDRRRPPIGHIGLLRFASGIAEGAGEPAELEKVAILDLQALSVVAMLPERIGAKKASWAWENGKVVVTAADGMVDEVAIRGSVAPDAIGPAVATLPQPRRPATPAYQKSANAPPPWAPWAQPQPQYRGQRQGRPQKQKSLFDLLFGN